MDKVALLLPDEKGVAQSREDEASQDLSRTGMSTQEAEAMRQQEDPQAEDGQTFDEGAEPGGAGRGQPQDKVHTGGLEEWHQLGSLTFDLEIGERPVLSGTCHKNRNGLLLGCLEFANLHLIESEVKLSKNDRGKCERTPTWSS